MGGCLNARWRLGREALELEAFLFEVVVEWGEAHRLEFELEVGAFVGLR